MSQNGIQEKLIIWVIWLKDDGTYELIPIKMLFKEEWFKDAF